MDNELVECGVAKNRVAMFKNLENGRQSARNSVSGDSKLRFDVSLNIIFQFQRIFFSKKEFDF